MNRLYIFSLLPVPRLIINAPLKGCWGYSQGVGKYRCGKEWVASAIHKHLIHFKEEEEAVKEEEEKKHVIMITRRDGKRERETYYNSYTLLLLFSIYIYPFFKTAFMLYIHKRRTQNVS